MSKKIMLNKELVVESISNLYRDKINKISNIENEIIDISIIMEDIGIRHDRFLQLEKTKKLRENYCVELRNIAKGIALSREIVFDLS